MSEIKDSTKREVYEVRTIKVFATKDYKAFSLDKRENRDVNTETENFRDLCFDIKNRGLVNPILVLKNSVGDYWVISGGRRLKACELLDVPVKFTIADNNHPLLSLSLDRLQAKAELLDYIKIGAERGHKIFKLVKDVFARQYIFSSATVAFETVFTICKNKSRKLYRKDSFYGFAKNPEAMNSLIDSFKDWIVYEDEVDLAYNYLNTVYNIMRRTDKRNIGINVNREFLRLLTSTTDLVITPWETLEYLEEEDKGANRADSILLLQYAVKGSAKDLRLAFKTIEKKALPAREIKRRQRERNKKITSTDK